MDLYVSNQPESINCLLPLCEPCKMDTVWAVLSKRFLAGKRGGPWSEKECTLRVWSWALPLTVCKLCPQDKWMKDTPGKTWPWRHCLYSFSLTRRRKPKSGKNSSSVVEIKKERKAELRLLDLDFRLRLFLSKPIKPENIPMLFAKSRKNIQGNLVWTTFCRKTALLIKK